MKSLITVSSLFFSFAEQKILEDISFAVKEKDFLALIGPNGSGKTTLVKVILGLLSPTSGSVEIKINRNKISYVPQRYTIDRNFPGTVKETLLTVKPELINLLGLQGVLNKKFASLSGGQQQRVLIALALLRNPQLLILDEPTAGVDVQAQQSFYQLLKKLNRQGMAIILVTHEVGILSSLVKTVLCINHRVCCMGTPRQIPSLLKQMYGPYFVHHHLNHLRGKHHD